MPLRAACSPLADDKIVRQIARQFLQPGSDIDAVAHGGVDASKGRAEITRHRGAAFDSNAYPQRALALFFSLHAEAVHFAQNLGGRIECQISMIFDRQRRPPESD